MIKRIYQPFILILFLSPAIFAGKAKSELPKKGVIRGEVRESRESVPVEYANVVLYDLQDSTMITGGITGPEGNFVLEHIPHGEYYITIHFIGFKKESIRGLKISGDNHRIDLGTIRLHPDAVDLDAASIVAEKMSIEYKLDRKVVNVDKDISSAGSSAVEVLEKIPSVRVDIEGNVSLRGSSSFTVLIDGKPSVLEGSDALQQIPAHTIENIEIITNPSAKYDPDGTSGIINVKLKKDKLRGFSGLAEASAGTGDKYSSDVYLNYQNSKMAFFGSVRWNDRRYPGNQLTVRETYGEDTTWIRRSESERAWMRSGWNAEAGMDYSITDRSTISVGGKYGNYSFGMDNFGKVHEYTLPSSSSVFFRDENIMRWNRDYYSLNANFRHAFLREGHNLNIMAFYSGRDGTQEQDKKEIPTDPYWNVVEGDPLMLRSAEEGPSTHYRMEADYVRPILEKGKFEAGYHFRINNRNERYFLENYDFDQGTWTEDEKYSKNTDFTRNIHALYGMFSHEIKDFEYQFGLRGEYTYRDISTSNTGETAVVDRFDYFPTVHFSRSLKEKNHFMASYSRRINRPRGWYLEPFETYVDEGSRRIGNPGLLPEYTNSFELGYLRTLPEGNVSLETYYRLTKNKITSIQYFDESAGLIYRTYDNLNNDQALGFESAAQYDVARWLDINLSATWYHYQIEDRTEAGEIRSSNNWDGRLITTFKLPTSTRFQVNLAYDSPTVTAQGRSEGSWYTDVTVRQDLFDKNLSATLKISDIFASRSRESYTQTSDLYIYEYRDRESRVLTLTISYRLNNYKKQPGNFEGGEMEM